MPPLPNAGCAGAALPKSPPAGLGAVLPKLKPDVCAGCVCVWPNAPPENAFGAEVVDEKGLEAALKALGCDGCEENMPVLAGCPNGCAGCDAPNSDVVCCAGWPCRSRRPCM